MVYHGLNDKRLKTITFPFNNGTHPTYYIPAEASDLVNNSLVSGETVKDALDTVKSTLDTVDAVSKIIAPGTGTSSLVANAVSGNGANTASGDYAFAEGRYTSASKYYAHAEGAHSTAAGNSSHAEGNNTTASGDYSHAEGASTTASGQYSHAEGCGSSYTEGGVTYNPGAKGKADHAEGYQTFADSGSSSTAYGAHAEGHRTQALAAVAHAEGASTIASGRVSHAEGGFTTASGYASHAEGYGGSYTLGTKTYDSGAKGKADHTEGYQTIADSGSSSTAYGAHAEGWHTQATASSAHAEGQNTKATASSAHAEGNRAVASAVFSHAEGESTNATSEAAHAEGYGTTAEGNRSHAEGYNTTASGAQSHAEGSTASAFGAQSHAEGSSTSTMGASAHAEGQGSSANGSAAHAEGISTKAVGNASHAEGTNTIAQTKSQHVFGEYNIAETTSAASRGTYVEIVGNGTGSSAKSNARTLDWSGNEWLAGNLTAGGGSITVGQTTFTEAQLLAMANGQGQSQVQSSGRITVYCWGDSLTEGVGGYVMQPDNRNAYMAYSYPAWLGQSFDVVNLGARGEDINAIMARQGADPIVIQTSFTIPAGADTPVKIGELSRMLTYGAGTGLTSKSGALVKINKEVESPGLNPCVIADVEGIIYRELKSSTDDNTTYDYYFRRLEDGTAVTVPVGTEVETYAMRNYRNGYAVIWMGANGGYTSHQDFANKVLEMVEYGNYNDYIVILAREFAAQWVPDIKALLTDEMGVCHVIYLMDQLPYRGYAMAGISSNNIDTSNWVTTDPIKKNAPLLCDYISSQSNDEDKYGALHFSAWGYKAIAKLVQEKLMPMIKVAENSGGGSGEGGGSSTTGTDSYGTYLYKLPAPRTFNGTTYLNTKLKLYEDVSSEWTVVCKYSGALSTDDAPGYPVNVLCCMPDGNNQGILLRYTSASDAMVVLGAGAFPLGPSYDNNTSINFDQTNVIIIVKFENTYKFYCNNTVCAYNGALGPNGYDLSSDKAHDLPLIFGARWNHDGSIANYRTKFTLEDARVYEGAMAESDVIDLYYELTQ